MLEGLSTFVEDIYESLVDLPNTIIGLLSSLLNTLFVPSSTYFSINFNTIKSNLESHLSINSFRSLMESIQNASAGTLPDIKINMNGTEYTFLSFSFFTPYLPTIKNWIKGFLGALMVLYNINQIYKLIRGGSLHDGTGGGGKE